MKGNVSEEKEQNNTVEQKKSVESNEYQVQASEVTPNLWTLRKTDNGCELGQGAYGIVVKGRIFKESTSRWCFLRRVEEKEVAVKKPKHPNQYNNKVIKYKFEKEIAMLRAAGSHPNIVKVFFDCDTKEEPCIVMEVMRCDLRTYLNNRNFPEPGWILQLARGLAHLHERGIAHCDIKPKNILVKGKVLKITDFDAAVKVVDKPFLVKNSEGKSQSDAMVERVERGVCSGVGIRGTSDYMSPELLKKVVNKESDVEELCWKKVDVWAFGVLSIYIITRRKLFTYALVEDVVVKKMSDKSYGQWEDKKILENQATFFPAPNQPAELYPPMGNTSSISPHGRLIAALLQRLFSGYPAVCLRVATAYTKSAGISTDFFQKGLAKDPDKRSSVQEIVEGLEASIGVSTPCC